MARKIDPAAPIAPPPPVADAGADDLAILHPDLEQTIAGRTVTIRYPRFLASLRVRAIAAPLVEDLLRLVESGQAQDATVEQYLDLLARHHVLVRQLMVDTIDGADADWIDSLDEDAGTDLLTAWWGVLGRFFVRLVVRRATAALLQAAQREAQSAASAGPTPSPSSSPADTATPTDSASATPNPS